MKKLIIGLMFLVNMLAFASADDVLGLWITEKAKDGNQYIIEIYEKNNKYFGKIVDMTKPFYEEGENIGKPLMDIKNPDENLRNREVIGIDFLTNLEYIKKKDLFDNGEIYVVAIGKTFHSYMKLQDDGILMVKGTIDSAGLFGKKQYWKRYIKEK